MSREAAELVAVEAEAYTRGAAFAERLAAFITEEVGGLVRWTVEAGVDPGPAREAIAALFREAADLAEQQA